MPDNLTPEAPKEAIQEDVKYGVDQSDFHKALFDDLRFDDEVLSEPEELDRSSELENDAPALEEEKGGATI